MAGEHVFISYCHEDYNEVSVLREDLIAAGEKVWWDKDILPGQDGQGEIRKALRLSYAMVACFSKHTEARCKSGVYPELRDAVARYREYQPNTIFIIPVRLSDCTIPPFPIDSNLMLDGIQYVDLFPASKRAEGIARLLEALSEAPDHP